MAFRLCTKQSEGDKSQDTTGLLQSGKSGKKHVFSRFFWKIRESQGWQGKLLFTMKSQGKIRENFFESNNDFVNSNFVVYLFVFMVMYVVFTFRLTIKYLSIEC